MIITPDAKGCNSEIIAKRSGHRSSAGLQQYMRPPVEVEWEQKRMLTRSKEGRKEEKRVLGAKKTVRGEFGRNGKDGVVGGVGEGGGDGKCFRRGS